MDIDIDIDIDSGRIPLGVNFSAWERMTTFDDVIEIARMVDDLGFAHVTISESFSRDGIVIADRLLAATSDIEVCFGLANPFSRSPGVLAAAAATLDELSGGRFVLALGSSTPNLVEGWHGLRFEQPLQRTRETVEMCHRAWRRDKTPYEGEIFRAGGVRLGFEPVRESIPIWSGSMLGKSLELTGEVFDGWIPGLMPFEHVEWAMGHIDTGLARSGRDRSAIAVVPTTSVQLAASKAMAGERYGIAMYYGSPTSPYAKAAGQVGFADEVAAIQEAYRGGGAKAAAAEVPDRLVRSVGIVGDTWGDCRDEIERRLASGVDRITIGIPAPTREACEQILTELVPR
jgi:alkanesulfonate monooxygenase SsuD/methylene tetrahydromethanopterin reductase-like flavin-dependent oxidoreductase (luciferase family)